MPDPETPPAPKKDDGDKTFTQAELDRIVADRLAREKGKYADYDDLKAKAAKLAELETSTKTETQKLMDRIAAAEKVAADGAKALADAEAQRLRLEVASAKGLSPAQAKRLSGTTREELEADAAEFLESIKPGATAPSKPKEDLKGGGDPTQDPVEMDPRKLAESVPRL